MLKNKTTLLIIMALVLLLLLGGGYFLFARQSGPKETTSQIQSQIDTGPQNLSPEEIDLELKATNDNKKVQFTIGKLLGIKAVSYELTYEADSTEKERSEGGDARIQRGITGEAKLKSGDSTYKSPQLDLGSCSKNVCRYDKGVDSVSLVLKITKTNNKIYQVEKELDL